MQVASTFSIFNQLNNQMFVLQSSPQIINIPNSLVAI